MITNIESMVSSQTFTIPYEVTPASRPRVTKYGVFYSKNYTAFRALVSDWLKNQKLLLYEGGVEAEVNFYVRVSKSWNNKKRGLADGLYLLSKKVDLDNMLKAVFDTLQGYCFNDDSQIVSVKTGKFWCCDEGRVVVTLRKIDDDKVL